MTSVSGPLLKVNNLQVDFGSGDTVTHAVNDISFQIRDGETVAIVGESGSGKSVTALSLTRLLPTPPAHYVGGEILFNGRNTLALSENDLRKVRGKQIAYIFQEPGTSLNPVFTIEYQIAEAVQLHRPEVTDVRAEVIRALDLVGIRNPAQRLGDYPYQLSGGMQQRVMIAMALACQPKLLVADEPTTALDVTIQKQIMDLLRDIKVKTGMSIMLITHNFGIIADIADRVVVMFRGKIVEDGPTGEVLRHPKHPYTRALIDCVPKLGAKQRRLRAIDHAEIEASA
ncbi:MAG: peptide ABC transporter ATP-binding protein [Verrucomicrobia bacterium Tous-C9LFEB]|nr:MAG: peptide ABC transporter ATP-binding protein [Verrucomicrobia bacterium Tous-C9LFEB]